MDLDYDEYAYSIKSTENLPIRVFYAYSEIHNYDQNTTTNQFIFEIPFRMVSFKYQNARCACVDVNYEFVWNTFDRWTVGLQLDNDVGSEKCLEYRLNNFDFLYGQIGIRSASKFYFRKTIEQLSELELIKLCLMTKNPSLYNLIDHPERVIQKLKSMHLQT
jgi:hypothetical protein